MPILILSPRYTPDSNALWKAAIGQRWGVERLHSYSAPFESGRDSVILYGEGLFIRAIAERFNIELIEPATDWLVKLPIQYLLREIQLTTLNKAREATYPVFIKPALDKTFAAKVYQLASELPEIDAFDEQTPVLIAEQTVWEIEFRCFVRERRCWTLSPYSRMGELLEDSDWSVAQQEQSEALSFIERLLTDSSVELPDAIVIDIGKIRDRGWAVVEANPAWASGIYGCEPVSVLGVLQKACTVSTT